MSLFVQLCEDQVGSSTDTVLGAQHSWRAPGCWLQPFMGCEWQETNKGSVVCHQGLSQLSILLTVSCSLSTIIHSPGLLLLSLWTSWPRPIYTQGKFDGGRSWSGRESRLRRSASYVEMILSLPVPGEGPRATAYPPGCQASQCLVLQVYWALSLCNPHCVFLPLTAPQR